MQLLRNISKQVVLVFMFGVVVGIVGLVAIRFFTLGNNDVHYHANFEIYINGSRDELKSPLFYEEEQSCNKVQSDDPKTRVHMHQPDNSVVHIHDHAVTWGAFFDNLGYSVGDTYVQTPSQLFVNSASNQLTLMLNGQTVPSVANVVIKDQDTLLVNFGSEDSATIVQRAKAIPNEAKKHDEENDPATGSGGTPLTFKVRLQKAIGIRQ